MPITHLSKVGAVFLWFLVAPIILVGSYFLLYTQNKPQKELFLNYPTVISQLETSNILAGETLAVKIEDVRPHVLEQFLKDRPLEEYSGYIVEKSDEYGIDYRLIPAIAMKESGAGANINISTHNAWGWENGRTNFDSWEEAIDTVAKTLKRNYIDKGLVTPEQIMPIYAPPQVKTGGKWAKDVNYFFSQMSALEF